MYHSVYVTLVDIELCVCNTELHKRMVPDAKVNYLGVKDCFFSYSLSSHCLNFLQRTYILRITL